MELILDIGSGRSLHNVMRAETMMSKVANIDTRKHKIVFKAQLFQDAPPNIPLDREVFDRLYHYAGTLGYEMTASVFDKDSLAFLLRYKVPFVKIACRPDLYWLIDEVPRGVRVYVSEECFTDNYHSEYYHENTCLLKCTPKYPARESDYDRCWDNGVSDHTVGWDFYRRCLPQGIWEKHLCPEREADNPDSGPFAVTPDELREVL